LLMNRPGGCTAHRMAEHYQIPSADRAKWMCDHAFESGKGTFAHILVEEVAEAIEAATVDPGNLRAELVQVAAVAVKWIEKFDQQAGGDQ